MNSLTMSTNICLFVVVRNKYKNLINRMFVTWVNIAILRVFVKKKKKISPCSLHFTLKLQNVYQKKNVIKELFLPY